MIYDGSWSEYGAIDDYDESKMKELVDIKLESCNRPMKIEL